MNPDEPGRVIRPGETPAPASVPQPAPAPVAPATPAAPPPTETFTPSPTPPVASSQQAPTGLAFDGAEITWSASEYLANPKSASWFTLLTVASVLLAVIVYFVTKDIISTAVIGILGLVMGVFAARQPRVLEYKIDNHGLYIGQKFYPYGSFKSFSIVHDQALGYISLLPLKRFMPPLTVHYDPSDEDQIAQTLAEYLPYEDHRPDVVDNITRRIRF